MNYFDSTTLLASLTLCFFCLFFRVLPDDEPKANSAGNRRPRVYSYKTPHDLVAGDYTIGSFSEGRVCLLTIYALILKYRLLYTSTSAWSQLPCRVNDFQEYGLKDQYGSGGLRPNLIFQLRTSRIATSEPFRGPDFRSYSWNSLTQHASALPAQGPRRLDVAS